ncbi:MAG: RnfABCDGE type electron transport complex subunit D [Planctomycetota bacterium]|jgi:Na(+)-translocating NADH:ubiquinone oxidoreductase B subunit
MKIVANLLEKMRPLFSKGGKFERLHCVFDAADNALFSTPLRTENAPFGRDAIEIKRYMFTVIIALMPAFLASLYFFGWRVLIMLMVSFIAGGTVEILFAVVRKEEIYEGFLVTGFIFPLILPPSVPLWMVAVGIVFGVLVGKEVFGGTGRNLFNAALVGRCFLALGYPAVMTAGWMEPGTGTFGRLFSKFSIGTVDAATTATPLVMAKSGEYVSGASLFLGNVMGSVGETSALAILLGGLLLLLTRVANWRTVFGTLGSFAGLGMILHHHLPDMVNPVLFNMLSGGLLFGAFFMATDPVTGPVTRSGKWAYGILIGTVTLLIRSFSGYVEGVTFAILLGNISAPLIDEVVIRCRIRRYALER